MSTAWKPRRLEGQHQGMQLLGDTIRAAVAVGYRRKAGGARAECGRSRPLGSSGPPQEAAKAAVDRDAVNLLAGSR
jgi:hypothetical protein